jgi:hypothetical protein
MRTLRAGLAAAFLLLGVAACGDDDSSSDTSDTTASASASASGTSPEDLRTTDEAVATGLGELTAVVGEIAGAVGTDDDHAEELVPQIEEIWQPIEGTIRENDQDAYLAFEDNFAVMENAVEESDADLAAQAETAINEAADAYLAEFPG